MPLSDFPRAPDTLSAEKRTMRTCFPFSPSLLLFSLSFAPFPSDGAAVPHRFAFFLFVLCFCLFLSHGCGIYILARTLAGQRCPALSVQQNFPFQQTRPRFQKSFCSTPANFFFRKRNLTDSMTGGKGDVLSPFPPVKFFTPNARQRFHPHGTGALFHEIRNAHAPRTCIRADGRPDRHHARRADAVLLLDRLAQQFRARRIGRIADVIGL